MIAVEALAALLAASPAVRAGPAAAPPPIPRDIDAAVVSGIERVYALDLDAAEERFRLVLSSHPDHPDAYYGMAAVSWMRAEYGPRRGEPALDAEFDARLDEALRRCRAWLDRFPGDPRGRLTLGGAYGMRSRFSVVRGRWVAAALDGRRAVAAVRQAYRLDPGLYDALLGIGMWEYYADVFPRFIRALGRMVLGGDRAAGLAKLREAAAKGRLVRITAQLVLIEIFIDERFGDFNPTEALAMIRSLRRSEPESPLFRQIEQVCLYAAGRWDEVARASQEYLRLIDTGARFHYERERPRMHFAVGMARWRGGDLEGARESLELAASFPPDTVGSPWRDWAVIRLGQLHDAMGRREAALERYRAAASGRDPYGYRAVARRHLKRPFAAGSELGFSLPPP